MLPICVNVVNNDGYDVVEFVVAVEANDLLRPFVVVDHQLMD
jgi:hypothetical protein